MNKVPRRPPRPIWRVRNSAHRTRSDAVKNNASARVLCECSAGMQERKSSDWSVLGLPTIAQYLKQPAIFLQRAIFWPRSSPYEPTGKERKKEEPKTTTEACPQWSGRRNHTCSVGSTTARIRKHYSAVLYQPARAGLIFYSTLRSITLPDNVLSRGSFKLTIDYPSPATPTIAEAVSCSIIWWREPPVRL